MQILVHELNQTAERMSGFHETLNIANIPGAIDLFETVKNEFMPGFRAVEDLDLHVVTSEIKRAAAFVETLDKDKIMSIVSQYTVQNVQPGLNPYGNDEQEWFEVELEDDFEFDYEPEKDVAGERMNV